MSEPTLTEEDREALRDWYFGDQYDDQGLVAAVERIIAHHRAEAVAAALRPVEALAAKWLAERDAPFGDAHMSYAYAQHELLAAVAQGREDAR